MPATTPRETRGGLSRIVPYLSILRGQLGSLSLVVVLMLVSTAINLAIPLRAGDLVDRLANAPELVRPTLLVLAALLVAQLLGNFLYQYVSGRLGLQTVTRLRQRLFAHLLSLPSLYYTHKKPGDLSSRITSDVGSLQYLLTSGLVATVRAVLTAAGALFLMYRLNVKLTLVVVLLVPGTILLVSFFGRRLRRLSRRMYDDLGELSNHVQEVAGAIRAIKVFTNEDHEQVRFDQRQQTFLQAGIKRTLLSALLDSGAQIMLWSCLISVVVYGFYLAGQGETTNGELVSFMLLAFRVATPLGALTGIYAQAQGAAAAADRLDDVMSVTPEIETATAAATDPMTTPADVAADLEVRDVSFRYSDDPDAGPTLDHVDFDVAAGEKIALVGPSGAGKTTLACLLLRLFDPQEGELCLGGRSYRSYDLRGLRRLTAFVPQEPVLYDASIEDNIRFGLVDAPFEAVRQAAERAQAASFVERLPDGFATEVGDRGVRLSGGERQRLALARAFLRDPQILVLDEPTSALDAASEEAVRQALAALMQGRTTIVVAHRLSLVRDLDRIIVLDRGKVVETGPHAELVARDGLYARLYHLQQGRNQS